MGFYDCRCMATGVSLKGADTALVLLQPAEHGFTPITFAIHGSYNRYGSIDMIEEDLNTNLVLDYFVKSLASREFEIDQATWTYHKCYPIKTLENLLCGFERNINERNDHSLNGQPVSFSMIAGSVWKTLAKASRVSKKTIGLDQFRKLSPVWEAVYGKSWAKLGTQQREFLAVDAFLESRNIPWQPTEAGGQDYPEEMQEYLNEARQKFSDSKLMLSALDRYAKEVADLLVDEEDE